jgi:hypothetical protein
MPSTPVTMAPHQDVATPAVLVEAGTAPAGQIPPHTPVVRGGVSAAAGAGEAKSTPASPAPVPTTPYDGVFAGGAAASETNTVSRRWIVSLWQQLPWRSTAQRGPQRYYPPRRDPYFERAAMARAMERL